MPRIINDPALEICPSFEDQGWGYLRQMMIDMHQGPQPLTVEEATQRLKDTWAQEHEQRVAQWQAQREQDNEEAEEQARQAHEEEEARRTQRDREAEEQCREAEKRKPKLNFFFFFESEFVFRSAYNLAQGRSRVYDVLCLWRVKVGGGGQRQLAKGCKRIAEWGWSCVVGGTGEPLEKKPEKKNIVRSSRLPGRPRLGAGTSLLQKSKRLEDVLRLAEELRERASASVKG